MIVPLNRAAIHPRIKEHVTIKVGDLVPQEFVPRQYAEAPRSVLQDQLGEVGFPLVLLGYRLPDGRLKLMDGKFGASLDPDVEVIVEVLDLSDDEAHQILQSLDFAWLAGDTEALDAKRGLTGPQRRALDHLGQSISQARPSAAR